MDKFLLSLVLAFSTPSFGRVISGQTTTTSNASGYSMTGTHMPGTKFAMDVNIVGGGSGGGPVTTVDGGNVVLGSTTDAKTTLTDATSVSIMSVLKQISFSAQNPPTQVVTGSGSFTVVQGTGTNLHTVVDSGTVTANIGTIGTIATESTLSAQNTLIGAVTETAPASDTASSGLNGRLQRIAQNITSFIALFSSSSSTPNLTATTISTRVIPYEPQTYRSSAVAFVPPASATDVCTLTGSASKTIRVNRAFISGTTTSGSAIKLTVQFIKRSTADTGGTAVADTVFPVDSANSAGTATVNHYTANPTLGTTVGVVKSVTTSVQSTGMTSSEAAYEALPNAQPVTLRGTSQQLSINLNTTSVTGPVFSCTFEWTEI